MPRASVVIRAKDEAAAIGRTLAALGGQTLADHELVVVDSGSTDATTAVARAAGALLIEIPAASFTFGGALNTGCAAASAPVCVALSAHAVPLDEGWLERVVAACEDEGIACASGDRYGPDGRPLRRPLRQTAADGFLWGYSNAAGAFRRELWRERPFREDLRGSEDKEWAWHWMRRGWCVLIAPDLVVEHDHTHDPVGDIYRRSRREWEGYAAFADVGPASLRRLGREWWTDLGTYSSPLLARLSHRRAARLLGAHAGRRRGASAMLAERPRRS